ncbi:MAG: T9SS type A sorting domain-containing protein, partial [Bacteroidales bacterium]|nr:T9SS type A sorting domain-containing protein [Bacteroidales bacterium]
WNVRFTGFLWDVTYSTDIYRINGDSTVNSKTYQKLWASSDSLSTWTYQGLVREEGKKVYFMPLDRSEGLLYDFDLEIGDTARVVNFLCDNIPVQIIDKDTITLFGKQRVRWHISNESYNAEYWIEGIGSSNGPIHTNYMYNIICSTWDLLCLHQNDSLLYMLNSQIGCYHSNVGVEEIVAQKSIDFWPNPVKKGNAVRVDFGFVPTKVELINSSGKVVYVAVELTQNSLQIETNSLATGFYLIRVINQENKTHILKLIVN